MPHSGAEARGRTPKGRESRFGPHPSQASDARSTKDVHQDAFSLIVGVMRHGDGVTADLLRDLGQEAIAHLPRSLFDSETLTPGIGRYVACGESMRQAPLDGQSLDERSVLI